MNELREQFVQISKRLAAIVAKLDPNSKKARVVELEQTSADINFWKNEDKAKKVMQELAHLKAELEEIIGIETEISDVESVLEMVEKENDDSLLTDLEKAIKKIDKKLDKLEIVTFLSGKFDRGNAIVAIHSGQGGTEAMDWAEMLLRMFSRYVQNRDDWQSSLVAETRGEEAGIKSATLMITGPFAYGYLKREAGTHRLVRQSPFNADKLRQTSFALVEVLPEVDDDNEIEIKEEDVEWQFFRSGGKGGQNVNKVSTAVRLKHLPSGITVESQTERYQEQNRKIALSILKSKLWLVEEEKRQKDLENMKGQKVASWGSQIRSYVLHPYKLVKDVRTGVETSDAEGVLGGDLDSFIEAELKLLA